MNRIIAIVALFLIGTNIEAYGPFYDALQNMECHTVPRSSGPDWRSYKWGPNYLVSRNDYALNLYTDIRLNKTYICKNSPFSDVNVLCRIPIPDTANTLLYCCTEDCDWAGGSLVVVNEEGYVLDSLISDYYSNCSLMQWSISSDWKIKITSLAATEADRFEMGLFKWFIAQRTDKTYVIRDGKFVLISNKIYEAKKYTAELLQSKGYDLMNGGETPMN